MDDTATITVDKAFLSMAVTTILQIEGRLPDNESLHVIEWTFDEDNDYLILICNSEEELIN